MALRITGIFIGTEQAKQAVENLVSSGFTLDCIDFSINNSLEKKSSNTIIFGTKTKEWKNVTTDADTGSVRFSSNTIDSDERNDTCIYTHVADRALVVTVRTEIDELAKLAAGILDDSGAVDIEKHAAGYGFGGEIVFDRYKPYVAN